MHIFLYAKLVIRFSCMLKTDLAPFAWQCFLLLFGCSARGMQTVMFSVRHQRRVVQSSHIECRISCMCCYREFVYQTTCNKKYMYTHTPSIYIST